MKVFVFLVFPLLSVSFVGNTEQIQNQVIATSHCTHCWDYADGYEGAGGDWQEGYDYCNENLESCEDDLEEVIIDA